MHRQRLMLGWAAQVVRSLRGDLQFCLQQAGQAGQAAGHAAGQGGIHVLEQSGARAGLKVTAVGATGHMGWNKAPGQLHNSFQALRRAGWQLGPGAVHSSASAVRHMSAGTAGVDPATMSKARRISIFVGGLAGLFGSFVGVGGGVLISPVIANACRSMPQRIISGTSLAAVVAVGSASGIVYWQGGYVDMTSAMVVAAAAIFTSPLGARATHLVNSTQLRQMLGYWLYIVSPLVPLKVFIFSHLPPDPAPSPAAAVGLGPALADSSAHPASTIPAPPLPLALPPATPASHLHLTVGSATGPAAVSGAPAAMPAPPAGAAVGSAGSGQAGTEAGSEGDGDHWLGPIRALRQSDTALALVGAMGGFASGLLGVGGGTIITPLLALLTGLPQMSVIGTSLAAMAVPATVGLTQHAWLGNVDWRMAAGLVVGSFTGSLLGSNIALNMPPFVLEMTFAFGMAFLGNRTLAVVKATKAAEAAAKAAASAIKQA